MLKRYHQLFMFYLSFILLLSTVLAVFPDIESNAENNSNPIPELYQEVTPNYMKETLNYIKSALDGYVFYDILESPPYPYNDSRVDWSSLLDGIETNTNRPFYEFYRDFKKSLAALRDSNFDIIGGNITLNISSNDTINFGEYRICLPLQLYIDYKENQEAKIYIKEYPECSKYYDETVKTFIKEHEKVALEKINGTEPFEFVQNFFNDFYSPKNNDSYFNVKISFFHDKFLSFTPFSIEQLNYLSFQFNDNKILETKYHIIKGDSSNKVPSNHLSEASNEQITWDIQTKGGEVKCRVDKENEMNVLFFNKFSSWDDEEGERLTIFKCSELFYSNDYKIVIITEKLADGDIISSYIYTQILFPKIDVKFNMAMRKSELSKALFDRYGQKKFIDAQTCLPFESWEDFLEKDPDYYGEVEHYRTKIYNPIGEKENEEFSKEREKLIRLGHLKKSTEILIFTDTVNFGPGSNFIKTIQNNGAAIVASYAGNPKLEDENKKTLDASLDPVEYTNFEDDQIFDYLKQKGFIIYKIPFAERFESTGKNDYPMAFKVNKPDERTNIYHTYEDTYYNEFIEKAKVIFDKYKESCNPENMNLVKEDSQCNFGKETFAHGGFQCGYNGKWDFLKCKKSFCDIGYYYNKASDKCEINHCIVDEVIEINEEQEKIYTIEPNKRYKINLNTNSYTYFFKSPIDNIITYPDSKKCSKFCVVKQNIEYMYINYNKNLENQVQIAITSKKLDLYVESIMAESPKLSYILPMAGKMIYIFQLTEDNYMYIDSFDKSTRFYYTLYNEEMTPDDIININKKYFTEGLDQYLYLQAGKIYIGVFNQEFSFTKLYIYNDIPTSINLENGNMPILFLKNNSQYELDFSKNTKPFIIRLSEKTNATLVIKENNIPTNLDLNNKYFNLTNQPFKGKLYISDIDCFDEHEYKKGAFIEILYSFGKDETQVIDKEVNNELIEKNVTLIEYVKNENNKKILEILVNSNMPYKLYTYGGLSKDNYFYYSKDGQFTNYKLNYAIKLEDPLKDLQIESGEKYYIALVITKSNPNQEIKLTTKYYGHPIEELYEIIDESYAKNVLSNLTTIIENNYIFYDIVKNPPQPIENVNYSHPAFDFREEFEKISTENRRFYDFYQDIKEVLGKPRDLHFNIQGIKTPKGIKFSYMTACLPFSYYVNKKSGEDAPKVYIRYFPDCAVYFSQEVRENVQLLEKNQTALVSINGQNPFDFIQNRGTKYWGPKSPHAHFTWIKTAIHNFPLNFFPYSPEELDMVYKFENIESTLNISYHIFIPNFREMNYLLSSSVFSEEDFDEFVQDWQNKHKQEVQLPNIFDMIKEYKKNKEILLGEEEEEKSGEDDITWDFQTPEKNGIKCRVDDYNHLNVIVQGSFSIDSIKAQEVIYYCSSKFHDNNYPVVVIENNNGGGWAILSSVLSQLLLVKSVNKEYVAYKQNEALKGNYQSYPQIFYDVDTGKTFASFEDFLNGTTDNYSTPNQTILHKKTNIIDFLDVDSRLRLKNLREQFINAGKSKKPTDIIIFTDSFAYSATSIFIKYFQNIGGAITVGFNGNPTLGKELFDASQSPSPTTDCSFTQEFKYLKELGIEVNGITFGETFDDDYKLKDPIPREYKFDPVDEMSEIYEPYTDENYQAFMDEAKKIFGKYANGSCNPNNTLLLLWNDSCTFENDTVAHGGNPCGADGAWDLNTCKKSYCDVGYYYSKTEDKCLIDYATNPPNTTEIILNDIYNGTITIDDNSEYIIRLETNKFVYFFEASEPGYMLYEVNNPCPSYLCALQMNSGNHNNKIYLNYFRNAINKQITFNITSVPNFQGALQSLVLKDLKIERIIPNPTKIITIIESIEEYIYYFKVFDDTSKMFCAEYSKEMSIMDIVEVNSSYFREFKNQLIKTKSGKIYIFVAITESPRSLLQMFMEPKTGIKDLTISDEDGPLVMYFSSGIEYTVDFINNKYDRMIQLSKSTLNSKIEIKNSESGNIVTLDSKNSYYSFDTKIFKGKLTISVKEGDEALIEFLFAPNDYEIIDNKNLINYRLTKPLIIKLDKNSKNKEVSFLLSCESTKIGYSFITYYSKNNYTYYPRDIKPTISGSNAYRFNIYNKKEELEEGESFSVVIYIDRTLLANNVIFFSKIDSSISQFPELYQEVTPDYMKDVVKNIKSLLNSFVFLDILKNPPSPYNDSKVDLLEAFDNIATNEKRPFYEFYRDIKTTIGKSRDGSLEILGGEVPLDYEKINFEEYVICLPFKLYLDYNETKKVKMYMKEFPECSKYYDESVRMTIRQNLNKSVEKINGTDSFEFITNYLKELYNMKNPESQFNNIIEFFHYNNLIYTPLLPEQISYINLTFNDNECLETYFHIEKESILNNSNKVSNGSEEIPWNFQSENGEVKCRFDEANQLNVLLINGLVLDKTEEGPTLFKCYQLIYSNKNKLLIITRQLWEGGNIESYTYTQLLFPNINVKFNMAMKQTEYNKRLFEQNKKEFTDAKTCSIFESWEDFLEKDPDKYGEINHYRTKLYNPMPLESIKFFKEQREILVEFGLNKKSTDILILTDTVNFGPASNFIKTILNNGGAIVASYAGNPKLKEEDKKVLDAGVDPAFTTTYEDTEEYRNLKEKGFTIYNIPYAEYFEKIERNDYPMAFKVNKVDERTKIYHTYEDIYYDEFIEEAKEILEKYNNKSECNKENMNLVLEDENCTFEDGDIYAHGGYPCGNDGKWNKTKCKKSYCDIGYYYDKDKDKCIFDLCTNNEHSPISELYQKVSSDYMKDVVKNIKSLLNSYVFLDIMKNPPSPYNDSKVDLLEAFDNITTNESRPFYEFYRDIKTTLGKSRDSNLDILGGKVLLGNEKIDFSQYIICLPFKLYLDYTQNNEVKMYMKEFPECSKYYDESVKMTIQQNLNKPIEYINGEDPFEFIVNHARDIYNMKNPESQFNNIIEYFHYNELVFVPLSLEKINNIRLVFNDNEFNDYTSLETHFHINKGPIFDNENKNTKSSIFKEIPWNLSSKGGEVKCYVDETNQINVILINEFYLEESEIPAINRCSDLFYSNDYKIVIITRQLWVGGNIQSYYYAQSLFPKLDIKFNMAMKQTDNNRRLFENDKSQFLNVNTCLPYQTWEDLIESTPDDYGEGVMHNRTKIYNPIPERLITGVNDIRKALLKSGHNKTSTDVLILTDTVAFGSASNFIKTIQKNGGAIFASYAGNPKLKEEDEKALDASLDPVFTDTFKDTEEYKKLEEDGFIIFNIPYGESFEFDKNNDYPMAFKVNKVDERTKIYHTYEDIYYDEFIEEAKEIFDKYNNKSECNSENMNLVLEDENCTFEDGDIYAHGGYPCGNDGKWNKTKCKKSYCDIGYYYDKDKDKCLIDYCTNDPDTIEITLNGKYDKTIIINKENNTKYILKIDTEEYLYFFQSNESGFMYYELDNACPSLVCVLQKDVPNHNNKIILNPLKEVGDKEITIKITSIKNFRGYILSTTSQIQMIQQNPEKLILISEPNSDYIYYFRAFDNSTKILFKEYDEDMKVNDLIEAKDFTGYNLSQFDEKSKGKIYIFMAKTEIPGTLLQILVQEKIGNRKVTIPNKNDPYVLYFSKDNEYSLDFKDNQNDIMLQLSKSTLDSEITITNEASQKTETLSSKHSYYSFDKTNANFKDKLTVKVNKGNGAAIELLYKADNFEILGEKEYNKTRIDKSAIIKLEKNTKDKNINITLESESGNKFGFSFITTYIKDDYISSTNVIEPSITGESSYKLVINNKKETLEEGESFAIILYINKDTSILVTKVEEKGEQKGEGDEDGEGLEGWIIAIIVIAVVIVVIVIAILIWKFVIGKDHVDSDAIGSLVDHNAPSNANELNEQN